MKTLIKINHNQVYFTLIFLLVFSSYSLATKEASGETQKSVDENFYVSFSSKVEPVPLNKIHQWVLHVEDKDGQPIENATVIIDGGMPAHNHGLPTQPLATNLGAGDYLIEGVKFSMTGLWEMWFYIQTEDITDKVKFVLEF